MIENSEIRLGMTEAQWSRFQEYTHGYGDQDENGVDISLLRANLKLTPTERLKKMLRQNTAFKKVKTIGNR